tara:strand:- start:167 stop:316 length:150 start_codon:yes stop_codon:yes gene_type:complete
MEFCSGVTEIVIQSGAFMGCIFRLLSFIQNHNYRKLFSEPNIKFAQKGL